MSTDSHWISTEKKGIDGEEVKYVKEGDEGIGIHHLFVDD